MRLREHPSVLLECLHLEALGDRVSLQDSLVTLGVCRRFGATRIVERRLVIVSGFNHGDYEGFLTFFRGELKDTLVDCLWLV
jgi:hypothetical protein